MNKSRRDFLEIAAAVSAFSLIDVKSTSAEILQDRAQGEVSFYDFQSRYSTVELQHLYGKKGNDNFAKSITPATGAPPTVFFYWDEQQEQLINPFNLKPDNGMKTGNYTLKSSVYNFHSSQADVDKIWSKNTNNVQLTFTAQAADQFDEDFQWIVMAGLNMASNYLGGADKKSLSVPANNQLTSFSSTDSVVITNSEVSLTLGLAAQKKESFWDHLIKSIKAITDSPLFGIIPMPKLASDSVKAISQLLAQVQQQHSLIPILVGKQIDFKLYEGSSTNPFVLKPGYWVIMDGIEAASLIDYKDKENIKKGIVLDIPGQQYDLTDVNAQNKPIDVTYAVTRILLPPYKS